jgi:AhpD family alkylhydroperoxidase
MNYNEISKETFHLLYKSRASLNNSPVTATVRVLAELCVSHINGCRYCIGLHTEEAHKIGVPQEKLDKLAAWKNSSVFSEEEKIVLQWAESVTNLDESLQQAKARLLAIYTEKQVVDLTACIALMNALNRIAICLRD